MVDYVDSYVRNADELCTKSCIMPEKTSYASVRLGAPVTGTGSQRPHGQRMLIRSGLDRIEVNFRPTLFFLFSESSLSAFLPSPNCLYMTCDLLLLRRCQWLFDGPPPSDDHDGDNPLVSKSSHRASRLRGRANIGRSMVRHRRTKTVSPLNNGR